MPGSLSYYAQSGVLTHLFRTSPMVKPGNLAIALLANPPANTDTGSFAVGQELANAGSYARQGQGPLDADWSYTSTNGSGTVTNVNTITFSTATANWGWVSGIAICDSGAYGAGNYLTGGALATPKLIGNGDQFKCNPGDLTFYID